MRNSSFHLCCLHSFTSVLLYPFIQIGGVKEKTFNSLDKKNSHSLSALLCAPYIKKFLIKFSLLLASFLSSTQTQHGNVINQYVVSLNAGGR